MWQSHDSAVKTAALGMVRYGDYRCSPRGFSEIYGRINELNDSILENPDHQPMFRDLAFYRRHTDLLWIIDR